MKVSEPNGTNTSNPITVSGTHGAATTTPAAGASERSRSSTGRDDQVQISTLSNALKTLTAQPAGHAAKLTELSIAVSAGRYHVDAQAVSHKLIQEHMRPAA